MQFPVLSASLQGFMFPREGIYVPSPPLPQFLLSWDAWALGILSYFWKRFVICDSDTAFSTQPVHVNYSPRKLTGPKQGWGGAKERHYFVNWRLQTSAPFLKGVRVIPCGTQWLESGLMTSRGNHFSWGLWPVRQPEHWNAAKWHAHQQSRRSWSRVYPHSSSSIITITIFHLYRALAQRQLIMSPLCQ